MTAPLESLLDALEAVAEARAELKECRDRCEHDAGYFCWRQSDTLDKAKAKFGEELTAFILITMGEYHE